MFTFWLRPGAESEIFLALAGDGLAHWHRFLCKYTNAFELISIVICTRCSCRGCAANSSVPGFYSLLGVFLFARFRRSFGTSNTPGSRYFISAIRGGLDEAPGFHPLELLTFLAEHFVDLFAAPFPRTRFGQ